MRISTNHALSLAALLLALVLAPRHAWAASSNCPTEPTQTTIKPGEVYAGSTCNLKSDGDIDSFTFNATKGERYQVETALNGATTDICVDLKDPSFNVVAGPQCSNINNYPTGIYSAGFVYTTPLTGTYTIDLWEVSSANQGYGLSLEQFYPFPSYAEQIPKLGESLSGGITPISDANLFTLKPTATTGEYLWTVTLPSNASSDICLWLYLSNGAAAPGSPVCTNILNYPTGIYDAQIEVSKPQAGGNMAVVESGSNDATQAYSLEVSCAAGTCPPVVVTHPPCTLNDTLSYNSTTDALTMDFHVGTNTAATWKTWLTYQNTFEELFSVAREVTVPPVAISKTKTALGKQGTVGVLSTLTTPTKGITCSSWQTINTGTP